ncbi:DNA-binding transcription factor [Lithospermum erythrorhizon]|uniref:DNA-binding transcription factor n=1 Tax=Lithospermum erythrorhizon TaxID=34254 RepID=A0AAV3RPK5_LITER
MASSTTQFGSSKEVMSMYDESSLYQQINMWEETFGGDISPTGEATIELQEDTKQDKKSETASSTEPHHATASGDVENARGLSEKVERRLAQNREAAKKSRLRKKAYVKQLETSRLKLAQLELELERATQQRMIIGGATGTMAYGGTSTSSGIASFEIKYGQWTEEQKRQNCQLKTALQSPIITVIELGMLVEDVLRHYYNIFRMKTETARVDAFYLVSGMWRTPIEKFFLWIGGFRPTDLINIIVPQVEPLTEQQQMDINNLRHSCQQAEEALTQGMDKLQQNLSHSISTGTVIGTVTYGAHLASSMEKLESLENFINQADHLRQQTLHHMCRILTTRQAATGLLAFGEYFQSLRSLSSLWSARPRHTIFNC